MPFPETLLPETIRRRTLLRIVLGRLLREPGSLVQPLVIVAPDEGAVRAELEDAAARAGLGFATDPSHDGGSGRVVLAELPVARAAAANGAGVGCQLVATAPAAHRIAPPDSREWWLRLDRHAGAASVEARLGEARTDGAVLRRLRTLRARLDAAADEVAEPAGPMPIVGPHPPGVATLIGAPPRGAPAAIDCRLPLRAMPLAELLRAADAWHRTGRWVVYDLDRFGWFDVVGDELVAAGLLGRERSAPLEAVEAMAAWADGTALFLPSRAPPPDARSRAPIPLDVLAFDLAARESEGQLRAAPRAGRPAAVAAALLAEGLPDEAAEVAALPGDADAMLLRAHLLAPGSPAAAATLFRSAARRVYAEAHELRIADVEDALLNALVLDVGAGRTTHALARRAVNAWLPRAADVGAGRWTARHAALAALGCGPPAVPRLAGTAAANGGKPL